MTEELQGVLTEVLNGVLSAKDFMLAELPEVIQQLLLWKFCIHLIWFSIGISLLVGGCIIICKIFKWCQEENEDLTFVIFPAMGVVAGFLVVGHNMTWLQIWLAPKVYLIEYAASLAK